MMQTTQIKLACQRAFHASLVAGQLFWIGCGGTSQDDMRRYAIKRTPEEKAPEAPADGNEEASGAQRKVTASPLSGATSESTVNLPAVDTVTSEAYSRQPTFDETKPNVDAVTTQINAIPSAAPPDEPLSPAERRNLTANNLMHIGEAWRAYLNDKRYFPGPIASDTKQPLLSWRVELLPYLGLQTLYEAFHLNEPWDSPHNITLLDKIPSVFQSPERFDTKTNYLALSLSGTTAYQERRRLTVSNVEDGIENTLALVEADDDSAVPWTQPEEFPLVMGTPLKSLGHLRENGLFVIWSDGKASWIDGSVDPKLFAKACTIDSGDGFRGSEVARELAAGIAVPVEVSSEAAEKEMVATVPTKNPADTVPPTVGKKRPTLSDAQASVQAKGEVQPQPSFKKAPIPSASDLKIARDLLRELYQADYVAAKTAQQRLQLARRMLDRLPDLRADIPGQYALLEVVTQISIQAGGIDHALDAVDQMMARFELPEDPSFDTFERLARVAREPRELRRLLAEADRAFDDLVLAQQYESAERLSQLAVSTASKVGDQEAIDKFTLRRQWASEAKVLYKAAEEGLSKLETDPEDPRANGDVGKFLCLVKNDWENGIVILANGNDRSLKRLAMMEIGDLSDPMRKLELADLWWREAETARPSFKATMQTRAKYWYDRALPGLPAGLVRIRVERRIEAASTVARPSES